MKKISNVLFLLLSALLLISVPVLTLLLPHHSTSYYEQRTLASLPTPSKEAVLDGSFFNGLETFAADHIGGRDYLLKADTALNILLQRPKVNNLLVNTEALLDVHGFSRWNLDYTKQQAADMAAGYAALQSEIASYGGCFCYLGVPLQTTYFSESYPDYMDSRLWHTETIRKNFAGAMDAAGVPFLDMHAEYEASGMPSEYYFTTDHHYTMQGAFAAYTALMEHLQTQGAVSGSWLTEEDFTFETLENPFLGSANRKLYGLWEHNDSLEIATPVNFIPFTRENNGQPVGAILTLPQNAEDTVTYSVYMGGDMGETVIKTDRPELPNILIYGDSFTNALETVLWTNFNETRSLDFRYYSAKTLTEYIAEYQPDIVICLRDEISYLSTTGNGITK